MRAHSDKYSCLKKVDSISTNCPPHFEMRTQDDFASFVKLLRRITALYIDCSSSLEEVYALYTLLFSTLKGVDALYMDWKKNLQSVDSLSTDYLKTGGSILQSVVVWRK